MDYLTNSELVEGIIKKEYIRADGKQVRGAYVTQDDAIIVCSAWTFETLLSRAGVPIDMTLAEADEKYGDEIIKRHESGVVSNLTLDEVERQFGDEIIKRYEERKLLAKEITKISRLKLSNRAMSRKHEELQAHVLREIMRGNSKSKVSSSLGISRPTVDKILKELNATKAKELFEKYNHVVFQPSDRGSLISFTKLADCDYNKYRTHLKQVKASQELEEKKRLDSIKQAEEDERKISEAYVNEMNKRAISLGTAQPFKVNTNPGFNSPVENKDVEASIEAVQHLLSISTPITQNRNSTVTETNTEAAQQFIEKVMEHREETKKENERKLQQSLQHKLKPRKAVCDLIG